MYRYAYPAFSRSDAGAGQLIDGVRAFSTFLDTAEPLSKVPGSELALFPDPLQHLKFLPD